MHISVQGQVKERAPELALLCRFCCKLRQIGHISCVSDKVESVSMT